MRPWQEYLLSKCPPESFQTMPAWASEQSAQWRYANAAAFHHDVVECFGPVAATCLSMAYQPKVIVEMGVFSGHTSFVLCRANPEARVYGVDKVSRMEGTTLPTGYTAMLHGVSNFTLSIGNSWDFAVRDVGLCFIDGEHWGEAPYLDTMRAWENRNDTGDWCIAWDDYHPDNSDVVRVVDRFVSGVGMELHKLASWFYIGTKPHSEVEKYL